MLDKGAACLPCRRQRIKCDGLQPYCSRCYRLDKKCAYTAKARRLTVAGVLEARILELELITHKLTLSSAHSLSLVSQKLYERIGRLGNAPKPRQILELANRTRQQLGSSPEFRRESRKDASINVLITQSAVEQELQSAQLDDFHDLPHSLSITLINLFLPFRSQWHFLADIPHFIYCLSLPTPHPEAIHPCLLNVCYLGACTSAGGALAAFKPHFLRRTRYFLQQSLMFADRHIHFLWANVILGVFLARERRIAECLALAGATGHFAVACGLDLSLKRRKEGDPPPPSEHLLPPPKDKVEANDRIRLAHTIFALGQALPLLCGFSPAFSYDADDEGWSLASEGAHTESQNDKIAMTEEEVWRFELRLKALVLRTYRRARNYAQFVAEHGLRGSEGEYRAIEKQIHVKPMPALLLFENRGLAPLEASSTVNPHIILAYSVLYGSGLILHSLRAHEDAEARGKMFHCVQALVEICDNARVRILSRELQRPGAQHTAELSISYCRSIELLLDYLDDLSLFLPAWADAPVALKNTLLAAAASISP
ncbi:hypothetical protein DL93DRAFT_1798742 [Clavulina sp. PMI_390]|nr:hypothetical protein DL93DRAFT_1798742 [Clavulina sp. PMI_390]